MTLMKHAKIYSGREARGERRMIVDVTTSQLGAVNERTRQYFHRKTQSWMRLTPWDSVAQRPGHKSLREKLRNLATASHSNPGAE